MSDQTLGEKFMDVLELRRELRESGASQEEIDAPTESCIRAIWPSVREWKYVCDYCSDTGWRPGICTPATPCGRSFTVPHQRGDDCTGKGRCSPGHDYVTPCHCRKGNGPRAVFDGRPQAEEVSEVGKTTKKTFTRYGR